MNKVENVEAFDDGSKPLEMLSEQEKNTPSEMRPDEITDELGEGDPSKKPSEETPEPEVEVPEEEIKKGEELEPKVEEKEQEETPEPTPKFVKDTEDRDVEKMSAAKDKQISKLRDDIISIRAQKRDIRAQKMELNATFETPTPTPQTTDEEGTDPEVEQQLEAILQKKGYVPESQIREKMQRETLDKGITESDKKFYEKYPEYLFSAELRNEADEIMESYPIPPKDIEEYNRRLEFSHSQVALNHIDKFPSSSGTEITKKQEALKDASLGAGSHSAPSPSQPAVDPQKVAEARRFYKGFTDDEIGKLLTK